LADQSPSAPSGPRPKDENLRLVLSPEQDRWIRDQIGTAKGLAWVSLLFLVLSAGWLTAEFSSMFPADDSAAGCYEVPADAPDRQELVKAFEARGVPPCSAQSTNIDGGGRKDLRFWLTLLAVLALVVSPLTLGRNLYLVRKYTGYLGDHEAFLRKYNRL
jgi:hypothetical protein